MKSLVNDNLNLPTYLPFFLLNFATSRMKNLITKAKISTDKFDKNKTKLKRF